LTVSNTVRKNIYILNNSTTVFSYTFALLSTSDLHVYLATGVDSSVQTEITSGFTINTTSKTVTYANAANYSSDYKLVLLRTTPLTQSLDLVNQGSFYAQDIENSLDKLTEIAQEHEEMLDRSVIVPVSSSVNPNDLLNTINSNVTAATIAAVNAESAAESAESSKDTAIAVLGGATTALAESTGYGVVNGNIPTISGLIETIPAQVIHMPDGHRISIVQTTITHIAADSANPRIDLTYLSSSGIVTLITGTPATTPIVPTLPNGGFSLSNVSVAANATAGVITDTRLFKNNILKRYQAKTYGNYENASAFSVTANSGIGLSKLNTQVNGTSAQGVAQQGYNLDHVAGYMSASSFIPMVLDSSTTYTSNTISNASISTDNCIQGMFIRTLHSPNYTGQVMSIINGTATVDGWFLNGTGNSSTPADSTGAIINPNEKIFGLNIVAGASGNGTTTGAKYVSGIEVDLATPGDGSSSDSGTYGVEVKTLNGNADVHFYSNGRRNIGYYSYDGGVGKNANYGFRSIGDVRGISIEESKTQAIEVVKNSVSVFHVDPNGKTQATSYGTVNYDELYSNNVHNSSEYVLIGPIAHDITGLISNPTFGGLYWISGYNTSEGAEYQALIMVRAGNVTKISEINNTGLSVLYSVSSARRITIATSSGNIQAIISKIVG